MSRNVAPHEFDKGWVGVLVKLANGKTEDPYAIYYDDLELKLSDASDISPRTIRAYAKELIEGLDMKEQVKEVLVR